MGILGCHNWVVGGLILGIERERESWRRILTEERLKDMWNVRFKDVGYMA